MRNQQNEEAEQCAAIILMEMTGSNEAERLYSTKELLNGPLRGVMGLRKFRKLLAGGEGPPAIRTTPGPKGHLRFRASDVDRWLKTFVENGADMTSYEPPSREERDLILLEVVAMIAAIRDGDYARLVEITHGSDIPVWKHCVESLTLHAHKANQSGDPEAYLADLRTLALGT